MLLWLPQSMLSTLGKVHWPREEEKGFVQRNLKRCPKSVKKTAYISLVRSTLEYGATVWDPFLEKDVWAIPRHWCYGIFPLSRL